MIKITFLWGKIIPEPIKKSTLLCSDYRTKDYCLSSCKVINAFALLTENWIQSSCQIMPTSKIVLADILLGAQ